MKTATITILALSIAAVGCGGMEDDLICFEDNGETICKEVFGAASSLEQAADRELASIPAAACEHCAGTDLQMGTAHAADPVDKRDRDDLVRSKDRDVTCPTGSLYNPETGDCQPTKAPSAGDRDDVAQGDVSCPRGSFLRRGVCVPAEDLRQSYPGR